MFLLSLPARGVWIEIPLKFSGELSIITSLRRTVGEIKNECGIQMVHRILNERGDTAFFHNEL